MSKGQNNSTNASNQPVARVKNQYERSTILAKARNTFAEDGVTVLAATGNIPLSPGSTLCDEKEDLWLNALSRAFQFATRPSAGFDEKKQLSAEELMAALVKDRELKDAHRDLVVTKQTAGAQIIHLALPSDHFAASIAIAVLEDPTLADELGVDMSQFAVRFVGGKAAEPIQLWSQEEEAASPFAGENVIDANVDGAGNEAGSNAGDGQTENAERTGTT